MSVLSKDAETTRVRVFARCQVCRSHPARGDHRVALLTGALPARSRGLGQNWPTSESAKVGPLRSRRPRPTSVIGSMSVSLVASRWAVSEIAWAIT